MYVLDLAQRIGCVEDLGAVVRGRDLDRGGMLAVDRGDAVGMQARPQAIVGALQSPLRVVQLGRELGVAREPPLQLGGESAARALGPPDSCRLLSRLVPLLRALPGWRDLA